MLFFSGIDIIELSTIKWNILTFDRNNKSYQMLLYICYFLTEDILMTTEKGKYKMKSFTDEHLCRLFEKFVLEYYRSKHPEYKAQAAQIDWNIDQMYLPLIFFLSCKQTYYLLSMTERSSLTLSFMDIPCKCNLTKRQYILTTCTKFIHMS